MGGAGATLATVLWSGTSSYCEMSSVAAPPRHPAPSISNTSVMYWMYRVGARECGFAILVRVSRTCTSSRIQCSWEKDLTCALSCHWCVRVNGAGAIKKKERMKLPYWCVREEELNVWWRVARLQKGTGNATQKGHYFCLGSSRGSLKTQLFLKKGLSPLIF